MIKRYITPQGTRLTRIPRAVNLLDGRSVSLPVGASDALWESLPGCTIDLVETPPPLSQEERNALSAQDLLNSNPGLGPAVLAFASFVQGLQAEGCTWTEFSFPAIMQGIEDFYTDVTEGTLKGLKLRVKWDDVVYFFSGDLKQAREMYPYMLTILTSGE